MTLNLPQNLQIDAVGLNSLCEQLNSLRPEVHGAHIWPQKQLELICSSGAARLFMPRRLSGAETTVPQQLDVMMRLSHACLSSTFVFSQHLGAIKRLIFREDSPYLKRRISAFINGERLTSLGLSHLKHTGDSLLKACFVDGGIKLSGRIPWVTGAAYIHDLYLGARLEDGRCLYALCPMKKSPTISIEDGFSMAALSETSTSAVLFDDHFIPASHVVNVGEDNRFGLATGGLTAIAMALGHAKRALDEINDIGLKASSIDVSSALDLSFARWSDLRDKLYGQSPDRDNLRALSTDLALAASQSLLLVTRGTGFQRGALAQLLCRQALFFLVWSNTESSRERLINHWADKNEDSV